MNDRYAIIAVVSFHWRALNKRKIFYKIIVDMSVCGKCLLPKILASLIG